MGLVSVATSIGLGAWAAPEAAANNTNTIAGIVIDFSPL
jgi:hypothetical protein